MPVSKLFSGKMVSLLELKQRCPQSALKKLQQFLQKRREYITRLQKLEESGARGQLPPIDWNFYKRNVRSEAVSLVEEFERKYTSLTVPYPVDNYTPKLEKLKEQVRNDLEDYVIQSNCRIEGYRKEIERIENLLPFNQMTWEDYIDTYPEVAPNFLRKPTFWPHDPSEQIGFVEEDVMGDAATGTMRNTGDSMKPLQAMEAKKGGQSK